MQAKEVSIMSDLGNRQIMAQNIRHYMEINHINQTELCAALGLKAPTFSDWVNAKTYPRIDKIELMANYFGISKADLVEDHTKAPPSPAPTDDDIKFALFGGDGDITDAMYEEVKSFAEFVKRKYEGGKQ